MAAGSPLSVTVPVPSPLTVTPVVLPRVKVPCATDSVVVIDGLSSVRLMALPPVAPNTSVWSSGVDWVLGSVCTGLSLTEFT